MNRGKKNKDTMVKKKKKKKVQEKIKTKEITRTFGETKKKCTIY